MAKKKNSAKPGSKSKFPLIAFIFIVLMAVLGYKAAHFLRTASYFRVKSVVIDPTLQFLDAKEFNRFVGQNIFTVDVDSMQNRLQTAYSEVAQLKIVRRFPNQILIVAQKRFPFAQLRMGGKLITVDEKGMILSTTKSEDKNIPMIFPGKISLPKLVIGSLLRAEEVTSALKIIDAFKRYNPAASLTVMKVDAQGVSKIDVILNNGLVVIMDKDNIDKKIKIFGIVLSQIQVDLKDVKYIDLRFKEPIIGKK